jgi:holo-[acyl-carrier protein] synthase
MKVSGLGIDALEIRRFKMILKKGSDRFIDSTFSAEEKKYCLSHTEPAQHFAGTFAAKEAVQKTLDKPLHLRNIEIRRQKSGKPEVWLSGKKSRSLLVSITHSETIASAVALRI